MDLVPGERQRLAGRGDPLERSLVGSAKRVAAYHLVLICDRVLHREMGIGEGYEESDGELIVFLPVQRTRNARKVTSIGGGEEVLSDDPFPLMQVFVEIPTSDSLVCFC